MSGSAGGMVWYGEQKATMDDVLELYSFLSVPHVQGGFTVPGTPVEHISIDPLSVCGRYDKDWNSMSYAMKGERNPSGGAGSVSYETQHVGAGVEFAKEPIWCYIDGQLVKEVPPNCGAHHYSDEHGTNQEGPAPGSEAESLLGDGSYVYNSTEELYEIEQ